MHRLTEIIHLVKNGEKSAQFPETHFIMHHHGVIFLPQSNNL